MIDQILGYDFSTSSIQKYINSDLESENDNILKDDNGSNIFPFFQNIIKDTNNLDEESKEKKKDIYFNDKKEKEEQSHQLKDDNVENSTKFIVKKRKRGPMKKKANNKTHRPDATDNCLRKINVHYLAFIVSFLNDILEKLKYKKKFYKLQYEFKIKTKKKDINSLKTKNIGQIIANNISDKYKNKDADYNRKLLKQIKHKVLNNILSENYLVLFKKFYFKSKNIINLGEYGLDKTISLSNKVKMFKDLLLKDGVNNKSFYRNMLRCIKRNFITDLIFLVNEKIT